MEVRTLEPPEMPLWDELVEVSPVGTVFHHSHWAEVVGATEVLGLFEGPELMAGIPVRPQRVGGLAVSVRGPYTPYLGPVFRSIQGKYVTTLSREKTQAQALALGLKERFHFASFVTVPGVRDLQPYQWEGFGARVRFTYVLDIRDLAHCWSEMDATRRRNIRSASKRQLTTEVETEPAVLVELMEATFTNQGLRTPPTAPLERALRRMPSEMASLYVTRAPGGRPLAASLILFDKRCAYYIAGGHDPEADSSNAMAATLWSAIEAASGRGIPHFDFEGSSVPAIEAFFRKFGGVLTPRFEVRYASPLARCARALQGAVNWIGNR